MNEKPQGPKRPKSKAGNAPGKRPKLKPRKKLTKEQRETNSMFNAFLMGGMMAVLSRALCRMPFSKIQPTGGDFTLPPKPTTKTPNPAHKPGKRARSVRRSRKPTRKPATGSKRN